MQGYLEPFAEIIKAAAVSPLGILALMILLLGVLAYVFFRKEKPWMKLVVFLSLFVGTIGFGFKMYNVQPVVFAAGGGGESLESGQDEDNLAQGLTDSPNRQPAVEAPPPQPGAEFTHKAKPKLKTKSKTLSGAAGPQGKSDATLKKVSGDIVALAKSKPKKKPVDCGEQWTGWVKVGDAIGNPCPDGCEKDREVAKSYRLVGFPPKPQIKYKFKCFRG